MIEVEDGNVPFAAIDARVRAEIFVDARAQQFACERAVALDSPSVRDARDIPRPCRSALTSKANAVSRPFGARAKWKLGEVLGLLANAADSG